MYLRSIMVAMLVAVPAYAQAPSAPPVPPDNYTITVTPKELDTIGNGLGSMPFNDAAPLIQKLRQQAMAQNKSSEPAKAVDNSEKK
jgi:hypothetical protein